MKKITNWVVDLLPNGVYTLTVNTSERWVEYNMYNDTWFLIDNEELKIPSFLPGNRTFWLRSSSQNKDQIFFYWIPFEREWIKDNSVKLILKNE